MTVYAAGPWREISGPAGGLSYAAPEGTVAVVDLRSIPQQSVAGHANGVGNGFFSGPDGLILPSEYTILGTGDLRELQVGGAVRSAWESLYGVRVPGDAGKLIDCLSYTLTDGADPEGLSGPKPLVPCVGPPVGECTINLAGHSVVYSATVDVIRGQSRHARSLRHMMQRELENLAETDPNSDVWRRVLASQKEKCGLRWDAADEDAWLTPKLRSKGNGRNGRIYAEPHRTVYSETLPTDGDMTSGQDLTWSRYIGSQHGVVISGVLREPLVLGGSIYRMTTDLSSSDHSAWCTVPNSPTSTGGQSYIVVGCRKDSSATNTTYQFRFSGYSTPDQVTLRKIVSGTTTVLGTISEDRSTPFSFKGGVQGSTQEVLVNDTRIIVTTDTAISGNTYCTCGVQGDNANSLLAYLSAWGCENTYTAGAVIPVFMNQYRQRWGK